jgi:membrane protease YdiL (CAAX protease family)
VALFIVAIASRRGRVCVRMRPRLARPSAHGDTYLSAFALKSLLAATLWAGITFINWDLDDYATLTALLPLMTYGVPLIPVAYVFARVRSFLVPLADWGWRRGRGVLRELSIGILTGLLIWLIRASRAPPEPDASDLFLLSTIIAVNTVVWTPILEETFYRGVLYRHLRDHLHWLPTVAISSVVFALMHSIPRMPTALASGLVYALLREWRGSLIAPMAAHSSWNLLSIAAGGHLLD